MAGAGALLFGLALAVGACSSAERPPREPPRLPEGRAGEILARAIDAAGGWEAWTSKSSVAFVSTTAISNPAAGTTSETLGLYRVPLHQLGRARFDSLGLIEAVAAGSPDGKDYWLARDGRAVSEPENLDVPRFNLVSTAFWFALPFRLAELPVTVTDAGDRTEEGRRYSRLRVRLADETSAVAPGDEFVIWFDERTGLIHRLVGHITAPFLAHRHWVGFWRDFREVGGLQIERRRRFLPSDEEGRVVGDLVVDQLVEDVRFEGPLPDALFQRPVRRDEAGQVASHDRSDAENPS